jgi:hypothetical protein
MSSKPLFTTGEPGFMGSFGSEPFHLELEGEKSVLYKGDLKSIFYFDGHMEKVMGFDRPYLLRGDITGEDRQVCQVVTPDGEYLDAVINDATHVAGDGSRNVFYIQG